MALHVQAAHLHPALVRGGQADEDGDEGGLAGAVGPQQAVDLPFLDGQAHVREGGHRTFALEGLADVACNHCIH